MNFLEVLKKLKCKSSRFHGDMGSHIVRRNGSEYHTSTVSLSFYLTGNLEVIQYIQTQAYLS